MIAQRVSPLSRMIAPAVLSIALGCSDASRPLPTQPGTSTRAASHDITPLGAIVLRGTVLTPDGAITHGYVGIVNGRIVSVSEKEPAIPNALTINTYGIIAPGLVDVHNHVPWNVMPRWKPGRVFSNQREWSTDSEYRQLIGDPFDRL